MALVALVGFWGCYFDAEGTPRSQVFVEPAVPVAQRCNSEVCADGCCLGGVCLRGRTARTDVTCGTGGGACFDCLVADAVCDAATAQCVPGVSPAIDAGTLEVLGTCPSTSGCQPEPTEVVCGCAEGTLCRYLRLPTNCVDCASCGSCGDECTLTLPPGGRLRPQVARVSTCECVQWR